MGLVHANIVAAGYGSTVAGVAVGSKKIPVEMVFDSRHGAGRISYENGVSGQVRLRVMDLRGREVARLADGMVSAGRHEATWDARGLRSGVYTISLEIDGSKTWSESVLIGR
jgi:hypothetical protein